MSLPRPKQVVGLLQCYVKTPQPNSSMVRVHWSQRISLIEKRENIHNIEDKGVPLADRMITFDGPDYLSKNSRLNSLTQSKYQ